MSTVNPMSMSRTGRTPYIVIGVVLVAIVLLVLWRIRSHAPAAAATTAPASATDAASPLELAQADVAVVAVAPLTRRLPLSGSVEPVNQATIKSKVSGDVLEMTVREGQRVRRGEMLARVDVRNATANNDSALATMEKSKADLAIAKLNYQNSVKLLDQKFVSQNAVDSSKATYDAAIAVAKANAASQRLTAISLEDATIRAPFDGVIARRTVQVGEKVSPDSEIFSLVDLSQMELDAPAPASEIPSIKVGQSARFKVDGFGDREFSGTVWRINPVAEQGSRSIMIYLSVPNVDGALKGGMFAQGDLSLDAGTAVPSVPLSALHNEAGIDYTWVIDGDSIKRRNVTLGVKSPAQGLVEIRDGLKPGEQVVIANIETLQEGTKVKLVGDVAVPKPADAGSAPSH